MHYCNEHRRVLDICFEYVNKTQQLAFTYNEVLPLLPDDLYPEMEDPGILSKLFHRSMDFLEKYGVLVKIYMYESSHMVLNPRNKGVLAHTNYGRHIPQLMHLYNSVKQYKYEHKILKQKILF